MSRYMLGQVQQKLERVPVGMLGTLLNLLEKLTGSKSSMWIDALKRFLRREDPWSLPSTFEVTTDGRSSEQFIGEITMGDRIADEDAVKVLQHRRFVTTGGVTYRLVLIMGDEFAEDDRTMGNIRARAKKLGYVDPPMEVVYYLQEMITNQDLIRTRVLRLVIMHKGVNIKPDWMSYSYSDATFLLDRSRHGHRPRLEVHRLGRKDRFPNPEVGFVFLIPEAKK